MTDYVAIIPCTNQKSTVPGPACEVWQGANFQLTLYHAQKWYDRVFIMSYKYGLIDPDLEIEPYDVNIQYASAEEKLEWWWQIKEQIKDLAKENPDLIAVYTGKYERRRFIREFIRNGYRNILTPWENARIGQRMQKIYDGEPPFDPEKVASGAYLLPENWGEPKKRGRPAKVAKVELDEDSLEWTE